MPAILRPASGEATRHSWAEHLIWMEGGEPAKEGRQGSPWSGVALILALTVVAFSLSRAISQTGWVYAGMLDAVLLGMVLGLAAGNFVSKASLLPGAGLAVRKLLPAGIILLGARMDFLEAMRVGASGLLLSAGVVVTAIGLLVWIGRVFGLDRQLALLLGIGTGICGGTAIVALAPILKADEKKVIVGVGVVTLVGLGAMIFLPILSGVLGLSQTQFGLIAGLTIHQTPQVIAAGFAVGEEAGQVATVTKLSRVCLLAPVAVVTGWWISRRREDAGSGGRPWYRLVPGFAVGFLLVALAKTFGLFPDVSLEWGRTGVAFDSADLLRWISALLLTAGMVGVGFQTRFSEARYAGWRPLFVALAGALLITLFAVAIIRAFF